MPPPQAPLDLATTEGTLVVDVWGVAAGGTVLIGKRVIPIVHLPEAAHAVPLVTGTLTLVAAVEMAADAGLPD